MPLGSRASSANYPNPGLFLSSDFSPLPDSFAGGFAVTGNQDFVFGQTFHPIGTTGRNRVIPTLWSATATQLITGLGDIDGSAGDINTAGIYTGVTNDFSNPANYHGGYIGRNGTAQRLNFPGFPESRAYEINDSNWFVGVYEQADNRAIRRGYVARMNLDTGESEIHDLGIFPGYTQTWAYAINNDNTIVGGALGPNGRFDRALIWLEGSHTPIDLNNFVNIPNGYLTYAYRINDAGQILADVQFNDGSFGFMRLNPIVPEPVQMALVGVSAMLLRRLRK
jgi:uncharacterized membrane protein